MRLRKNSGSYKILRGLLIGGGFLAVSMISPLGGAEIVRGFIAHYFSKKKFERGKFMQDLKRLQSRKLVDYRELPDGRIKITLTEFGRKLSKRKVLVGDLDNIKLNTQKRWDGKWRLVIFDIPHAKRKARDAFRQKLNQLGFYPIQKSVFLTPYECEDEIDFISSVFEVRKYVLVFYLSGFEGESKFKNHFGL